MLAVFASGTKQPDTDPQAAKSEEQTLAKIPRLFRLPIFSHIDITRLDAVLIFCLSRLPPPALLSEMHLVQWSQSRIDNLKMQRRHPSI